MFMWVDPPVENAAHRAHRTERAFLVEAGDRRDGLEDQARLVRQLRAGEQIFDPLSHLERRVLIGELGLRGHARDSLAGVG
jgi:hypothetical protein